MALPLLPLAKAAAILGPKAYRAAKLAYKMYKKKNKTGNKTTKKTKKLSEQKFISDKANLMQKREKEIMRRFTPDKYDTAKMGKKGWTTPKNKKYGDRVLKEFSKLFEQSGKSKWAKK
tara:strand:+ start:122 stop:475 length:354 start_codon:yes stop_codon:yes gene_type:complete